MSQGVFRRHEQSRAGAGLSLWSLLGVEAMRQMCDCLVSQSIVTRLPERSNLLTKLPSSLDDNLHQTKVHQVRWKRVAFKIKIEPTSKLANMNQVTKSPQIRIHFSMSSHPPAANPPSVVATPPAPVPTPRPSTIEHLYTLYIDTNTIAILT